MTPEETISEARLTAYESVARSLLAFGGTTGNYELDKTLRKEFSFGRNLRRPEVIEALREHLDQSGLLGNLRKHRDDQAQALQSILPKKAASSRRPPLVFPYRGANQPITGPTGSGQSPIAQQPSGIPIAQQLGNVPQGIPVAQQAQQASPITPAAATMFGGVVQKSTMIAGPVPSVAAGSLAHGQQQPIAGPPSNLSGTAPAFGASAAPVTAGGAPIGGGKGVAGAMGLGSQSGTLLSGGGAGTAGGQQDLLSAITELIECIKDLTEKLGEDNSKQPPHTPKTGKGEQAGRQQGGKDMISQAAQNAPGIEWANQMERWFASRFGRNNFGSG